MTCNPQPRSGAPTVPTAREWQPRTREALAKRIGLDRIASAGGHARAIEEVDRGDYVRQKLLLRTGPHTLMPVYLLLPKDRPAPHPVVLSFHGHGYGVKEIVGLWEDGSERTTPDGYHKDFAVALCRAGFAVAAPEVSCFGERQTDFSHLNTVLGQPVPSTCTHTAMPAFHLGISGGGMHTLFSACLDTRIRACNFVPGLAEFGEMHDLAGLIAPRPLLIEAGTHDPIFPIRAVRAGVAKARSVAEKTDSPVEIDVDRG